MKETYQFGIFKDTQQNYNKLYFLFVKNKLRFIALELVVGFGELLNY